jgi:hypothetical protein
VGNLLRCVGSRQAPGPSPPLEGRRTLAPARLARQPKERRTTDPRSRP